MHSSNAKKKITGFTEVKEVPLATVLMHCRTVVEKKDFVSTGIMTFVEGDLIEVEISDFGRFNLGESVKLTVYTPAGIYNIPSTIVGKDTGSLMVINPPENQRKFLEKREFPRVEVERNGIVASVAASSRVKPQVFNNPINLQVKNISQSGIGFVLEEGHPIVNSSLLELELDLGAIIPCSAQVVRSEQADEQMYYGAQFVRLGEDKLNSLRAFILREQISAHYAMKQRGDRKRLFK